MGDAKRKKQQREQARWPQADAYLGTIDLHLLPAVGSIDGAHIRELTGDSSVPDTPKVVLQAFRAVVGDRTFHVGSCLGNGSEFSGIRYRRD